jgi:fibronectin type 3 domain-containing protein
VWQDKATNETAYSVERSTDNKTWSVIASLPANSTRYTDTGLKPGATYYYRVRCFNGPTASAYSSSVSAVAKPAAPAQPGSLSAKAVSSSQINLTWQDKAINETAYSVERSTDNKTWTVIATLAANSASYADTGLSPGTTYYYRVRAFDGSLTSNYSSSASATTPAGSPAPGPASGSGASHGPESPPDGPPPHPGGGPGFAAEPYAPWGDDYPALYAALATLVKQKRQLWLP